jgi:hypothetical protein
MVSVDRIGWDVDGDEGHRTDLVAAMFGAGLSDRLRIFPLRRLLLDSPTRLPGGLSSDYGRRRDAPVSRGLAPKIFVI